MKTTPKEQLAGQVARYALKYTAKAVIRDKVEAFVTRAVTTSGLDEEDVLAVLAVIGARKKWAGDVAKLNLAAGIPATLPREEALADPESPEEFATLPQAGDRTEEAEERYQRLWDGLRYRRLEMGQLARKLGVQQAVLQHWVKEGDARGFHWSVRQTGTKAIAGALGISTVYLQPGGPLLWKPGLTEAHVTL